MKPNLFLEKLKEGMLSALYPPRCHLCGEYFGNWWQEEPVYFKTGFFCAKSPFCPSCTKALEAHCRPRARELRPEVPYVWLFDYGEETVQRLIIHVKYCRCADCHSFLGLLAAYYALKTADRTTTVTFIPRSIVQKRRCHFDQTEEMLKTYRRLNPSAPYRTIFFRDPHFIKEQKDLAQKERMQYASLSLKMKEELPAPRRILVFDDMITTGATALAAYQLLSSHGAEDIRFLFLAASSRFIPSDRTAGTPQDGSLLGQKHGTRLAIWKKTQYNKKERNP